MTSNKSLPISVIILVDTIDDQLKAAINSVSFLDEVVLVTQDTAIAQQLKINFESLHLKTVFNDETSFAKLRNWAATQARNELILFIDSDEILRPDARIHLSDAVAAVSNQKSTQTVFSIHRKDHFLGKPVSFGEVHTVEIIRGGQRNQLIFEGSIHETIPANKNAVFKSQVTIDHYPHHSVTSFISKIIDYSQIRAQELANQYSPISLVFQMLVYPVAKWIYTFIFKAGFKDGWRGLVYSSVMALHSFWSRVAAYEIIRQK